MSCDLIYHFWGCWSQPKHSQWPLLYLGESGIGDYHGGNWILSSFALEIKSMLIVIRETNSCLQFLLGHDFDADLLLSIPAPAIEYFLPVGTLLCKLRDLFVCADCCMAALCSNFTFAHFKVFSHNHHQLNFRNWEGREENLIFHLLSAIRIFLIWLFFTFL